MRPAHVFVALASTLALGACAVAPPTAPTVMAMPGQGKNFDAFQREDFDCRQYAAAQTGGASPAQAANQAAVGSAVLGTALGAGVGAALGSVAGAVGTGAAIGGATGLLAGSAVGAGNAQASAGNLQQHYDMAYTQCMYARGNTVQATPAAGYAYGYGYPYSYGYPYPYYPYVGYAPYAYGPIWGPSIALGFGFGGGWGWHGNYWHGGGWNGGGWHGGGWNGGGWHGGHRW